MISNRIPDKERAILSSIIFNPKTMETTTLQVEDFYVPFHQKLFQTMKELQKEGKPISDDFIMPKMEKENTYDENAFLNVFSANPISNPQAYEKEIKEFTQKNRYKHQIQAILNSDDTLSTQTAKINELNTILAQKNHTLPTIQDIQKVTPKTPKFFIKNSLPIQKNEITMITGSGGSGKSFVAIWIASMLTINEKLKVFAYLSEDSVGNTRNRLNILTKMHPHFKNVSFGIWGKESRPVSFISKDTKGLHPSEFFYQFQNQFTEYDVIILDPLIAFIYEDENSNTEARFLFNLLNEWCEKKNKTIILIHHHNKNNETRGASAFVDAVRLHYTASSKKNNTSSRFLKLEKTNHYAGETEFEIKLFESEFENNPLNEEIIEAEDTKGRMLFVEKK